MTKKQKTTWTVEISVVEIFILVFLCIGAFLICCATAHAGTNLRNLSDTTTIRIIDDKSIASSSSIAFFKWNLLELDRNISLENGIVALTDVGILEDHIRRNGENGSYLDELERKVLRVAVKEKKWGAAKFIIESAKIRTASSALLSFRENNIRNLEQIKANKDDKDFVITACNRWYHEVIYHHLIKKSHVHTQLLITIKRVSTRADNGRNIDNDIKDLEYWVAASSAVGASVFCSSEVVTYDN